MTSLRLSLRTLPRAKGFLISAVLTLGVGLGLNTAIFSLYNGSSLPRPVTSMYRLKAEGATLNDIQGETDVLSAAVAEESLETWLDNSVSQGLAVSASYFEALQVPLRLKPGAVILSHRAWSTLLKSDPHIAGRTIHIDGRPYTVSAVAPRSFTGIDSAPPDFWIPLEDSGRHYARLYVRLRDRITLQQAHTVLAAHLHTATELLPAGARADIASEARDSALPLLIAFCLTMAAPCVNVATLMFARVLARRSEIGIRLALGAARRHIIGLFVGEGVLLAAGGCAVGLPVALLATRLGMQAFFAGLPASAGLKIRTLVPEPTLDWRVFLYCMLAALVSALLFSLPAARQATRQDVAVAFGRHFAGFTVARIRGALVVLQIAFCVLLVASAATLFRNGNRLLHPEVGYVPDGLYSCYAPARALPWAEGVAQYSLPREALLDQSVQVHSSRVSQTYFAVLKLPLLEGRVFTADEVASGAPVAILSQTAARSVFPGQGALGRTVRPDSETSPVPLIVIGIVADPERGAASAYLPGAGHILLIRAGGPPAQTIVRIRDSFGSVQPLVMEEADRVRLRAYGHRVAAWLSFALGFVALLLTASGIYSVLAFAVSQREKEFAVRSAIGAGPAALAKIVVVQAARFAAAGAVLGGVFYAAVSLSFFECDVLSLLAATVAVVVTTLLAVVAPATRAARSQPCRWLRQ